MLKLNDKLLAIFLSVLLVLLAVCSFTGKGDADQSSTSNAGGYAAAAHAISLKGE